MSKRTAASGFLRLDHIVQTYLDKLEWQHPCIRSRAFLENSWSKWACKELLRDIYNMKELPFEITPLELLEQFRERMSSYACEHPNKEHAMAFVVAEETADYFIEEYWRQKHE